MKTTDFDTSGEEVYGSAYASSSPTATPVLVNYWQAIKRHRLLIACVVAFSLLAGIVITYLMEPEYTATSTIEISRQQQNVVNVEGVQPEEAGQNAEFYQTQYGLLQSRSIAERVVRKLDLTGDGDFFAAHDIEFASGLDSVSLEERQRLATRILLGNMEVVPVRGSGLVDLAYQSPSPTLSQRVANNWADEFIASDQDRRFASTVGAREMLERRLAELRERLEESERQLVTYARNREIVNVSSERSGTGEGGAERSLVSAELEALNDTLSQATARRIAAQSQLARGPVEQAGNSATIVALREAKALAAAEYAQLLTRFEPQYPAALALKTRMDELDRSIAQEQRRLRGNARASYEQALAEERGLAERVGSAKNRLLEQQNDRIQYNIFQRDADTNRELYDALLQRYKEIGVAGVGTNSIAIVDYAELPTAPSSPSLLLNSLLALLAGGLLSAIAVIIAEQIDQTIKSPDDVKQRLGLPVLAAVPETKDDLFDSMEDPKSDLSESYAAARTSLALSTSRGLPSSLMMTSTRPAEGKTTSAIAIASSIARLGKSVLIVDADMRNPSVHRRFDIENDRGLSNYLTGDDEIAALIHENIAGTSVMVAGPLPPNPSDLLSSDRMRQLIERLGQLYDTIIVDAPPVLGISDAPLVAQVVEEVIYVVEAGGAKIPAIRSSLGRLESAGADTLGVIVTKLKAGEAEYSYQYSYGGRPVEV